MRTACHCDSCNRGRFSAPVIVSAVEGDVDAYDFEGLRAEPGHVALG